MLVCLLLFSRQVDVTIAAAVCRLPRVGGSVRSVRSVVDECAGLAVSSAGALEVLA